MASKTFADELAAVMETKINLVLLHTRRRGTPHGEPRVPHILFQCPTVNRLVQRLFTFVRNITRALCLSGLRWHRFVNLRVS